jgi:seryl-tRNA synthetase
MQNEYNGKPIFRHRYVSMDEESIRGEIDRLQGEIYAMQQTLELFGHDNNDIKQQVADNQERNEKLLKSLEAKVNDLKDSLDYGTPLKKQLDNVTKDFSAKIEEVYNADRLKKQERSMSTLTSLTVINTILLIVLIGLIGYSILFI